MPTPFTHLEIAQRLLADDGIPASIRSALHDERPAFLLGSIAADARTESGLRREDTHFYHYELGIRNHPWRVMLQQHPILQTPRSAAQRAFLAGYVAHLSVDEIWSLNMLGPHFAGRDWAPRPTRFLMLHILLIHMDERDLHNLLPWQHSALGQAAPQNWLPFMNDTILCDWRDFIGQQIETEGASQTLKVFGSRINRTPDELRAILDSPQRMQSDLWQHITPELLAQIEAEMYSHARAQLNRYWQESQSER
ncbi:MAG: zinc dependent phospholipase C family protein [Anaerolineae bacterium]|nr:zinc dependent phospholipase C family protein [Anaerolineae bacterium]